jgi:hypothetical protein
MLVSGLLEVGALEQALMLVAIAMTIATTEIFEDRFESILVAAHK